MPRRYTEHYKVYQDEFGKLTMIYEEEWETIVKTVPDLLTVIKFARMRSPDWYVDVFDHRGEVIRRFTPNVYLQSVKDNPYAQPDDNEVDHYRFFHGVPPNEIIYLQTWVPGGMVLIGSGKDVGYGILNKHSSKDGWYVHDFGSNVKIYRRAKSNERPDKTWRSFPDQLTVLGYNIGFTYIDKNGDMKEVKGSSKKYLGVTPNKKTLVVVGNNGVEYLMEGGSMRVEDWIYD